MFNCQFFIFFSSYIFQPGPNYANNEKRYEELKSLGKKEVEECEDEESEETSEIDMNLINLRRSIYLTNMSCIDFEEAANKLLKIIEQGKKVSINSIHQIYINLHFY
ncbi:hypothetical protein MTR_5g096330 [Medicago truncatula]|uniref:Uncharacterized protein n=1 Tax=Medicago truncatula TaxID=3880 RepID=G7KEK3_MEDTR|nr:hypothetical protein MTR_5g096330 [Medicago truncatula]